MSIFRRHQPASQNVDIEQKNSVEINIAIDGQSYVTGMGVSDQELEAKIDNHLRALQAFFDQQMVQLPPGTPANDLKAEELQKLKRSLESSQSDRQRKIYDRSFLNIAEAYESWAMIDPRTYKDGLNAWDFAWSVLNREMLEAVMTVSKGRKDLLASSYVELLFARGRHCLHQMKYVTNEKLQNKYAGLAVGMFYTYLLEVHKLSMSHWETRDALKNIHIATKYGKLSDRQIKNITKKVLQKPTEQSSGEFMKQVEAEVKAFNLLENDRERLKQMIY
jgi:hypothetical protein